MQNKNKVDLQSGMGIEEIEYAVVAVTVESVLGVGHKQAILDVKADGLGIDQPNVFFHFESRGCSTLLLQ